MPNWCDNIATITHKDKTKIDLICDSAEPGILQALIPCPEELLNPETGSFGGENAAEKDALREALTKKYGYSGWYDWNCANWGTKWDLCDVQVDRVDDNTVTLSFQTAWSPPIAAYERLHEEGFEIDAKYYEGGMQFAGTWYDGYDDCYSDWGDSKGAEAMLPRDLDEAFAISENQAMWEEDEADEVQEWYEEGVEKKGLEPHETN